MKWNKPTLDCMPKFKEIVLGFQFPDKIQLVKLDRVDESGLVFMDANELTLGSIFRSQTQVNIDMWAEIEIPDVKTQSKEDGSPLNS